MSPIKSICYDEGAPTLELAGAPTLELAPPLLGEDVFLLREYELLTLQLAGVHTEQEQILILE